MQNSKIKNQNVIKIFKFCIIILPFAFCFLIFQKVQAATLFVNPGSGSFSVGSSFSVSVRTNTHQPANTAEATIQYSTDTLELVSVSQGSTFYLPAPGSPSKGSGTAYFGGGLPTPGYTGTGGIIGTMTFRARATGTATISVSSGKVLLNDGLGTNALSGTSGARYTIVPPPVGSPEVSSTTHPNPDGWANKNSVTLSWTRPTGAHGFSFELDQKPDTVPDNVLDTTITTTKTYEDLKDGVWYFHIKSRGPASGSAFGNTNHFRIGVDTESPQPFEVALVGEQDLNDVTRTPTIEFEAADDTSGIDYYSVYLDDNLVSEKTTSPYTFEKMDGGAHLVRVQAYDKAGNEQKAELPIIVASPAALGFFQKNLEIPFYVLLIINLLILVLVIMGIWYLMRKKHARPKGYDEIMQIQTEIDQSLETLRQNINEKLLKLSAKSSKELFNKEEQVARQVGVSVTKARKKVDKKLSTLNKKLRKHKIKIDGE